MAEEEAQEADESPEAEEAEGASGGGRRSFLIPVVASAALVLAGMGAGFLMFSRDAPEEPVDSAEAPQEAEADHPFERAQSEAAHEVAAAAAGAGKRLGAIFSLDAFIVNIGDGDRDRYLKLKADLELSKDTVAEEIEQRLPQIRDLIISLLGSKSFDDVRSIEGKDLLREEMLRRINALLVTGKARSIFFTEFVVQ
ncbi:MAG: flagellar basal body-associated FliL family protein [Myxococcales bacterium]|nr:flagellar basal body-associated FliL family protein [Myxococcales bacterium]